MGGGRRSSGLVKSLPAAERLNIFTIFRLSGTLRPVVPGRVSNLCTNPSLSLLGTYNQYNCYSCTPRNYSTKKAPLVPSKLEIRFKQTSPPCQCKQNFKVVSRCTRNSYHSLSCDDLYTHILF